MKGVELLAVYQRGLSSDKLEDKYLAYLTFDLCSSTLRSTQQPDIPNASGETAQRMNEGRRALRETCAPFLAIRLEQIMRDSEALRTSIRSPDSPFSVSLPDHLEGEAREETRKTLRGQFEQFGAAALEWNANNLSDWLLQKDLPPDTNPRAISPSESVIVSTAAYVAMCYAGFDCSKTSGGLLILCTQGAVCGDDLREALLSKLASPEDRLRADTLARTIGQAITMGRYELLAL